MGAPACSGAGVEFWKHLPEGMTLRPRCARLRRVSPKRPGKNVGGGTACAKTPHFTQKEMGSRRDVICLRSQNFKPRSPNSRFKALSCTAAYQLSSFSSFSSYGPRTNYSHLGCLGEKRKKQRQEAMFTKIPLNSTCKTMHVSSYPTWLEACPASCLFLPGRDWQGAILLLSPGFTGTAFTKWPGKV